MLTSRRRLLTGASASISALAFLRALPGGAADSFRPGLLSSADEIWSDVIFVNNTMGPTRLTGSPQHQAYVHYLKQQLRKILRSAGGDVFEDTYIAACLRAGRDDEAAERLSARLARRPSVRDERWLKATPAR